MDNLIDDTENQEIFSSVDLRKWRIEIPNLIDDSGLDPYAFRLLIHYYRVGNCYEGTRFTAEKCNMSVGQVVESRRVLESMGFIIMKKEQGETIKIHVVDKWEENFVTYSSTKRRKRTNKNEGVHTVNASVHTVNERINTLRTTAAKRTLPRQQASPKPKGDDKTKHPAIQAIFKITGRFPRLDQYDVLIEILGDKPDFPKMEKCWKEWRREKNNKKPYSPTNYGWLTDWYHNGIPGEKEPIFNDDDPFYYMKKVMNQ